MRLTHIALLTAACFMLLFSSSCSITSKVADNESVLVKNNVVFLDKDEKEKVTDIDKYIKQPAQKNTFGFNTKVAMHNISPKMGSAPILFDKQLVNSSLTNIKNHLDYLGYYNSTVKDEVETKNKKTIVNYLIKLGKSYTIDSVFFSAPDPQTLDILLGNQQESKVKAGRRLAESILEEETKRVENIFRNMGYFDFSKNHLFFRADTNGKEGKATLYVDLKDYTRNQTPDDAVPHKKYYFGRPVITTARTFQNSRNYAFEDTLLNQRRDSLLRVWRANADTIRYNNVDIVKRSGIPLVRSSFLDMVNLIKEGEVYNLKKVEDTYARFASLGTFTTVNIETSNDRGNLVTPHISLQAATLQGYKAKLQGSVNSNSTFGISPELSIYHKNLFRGAELFSLSLSSDFQFKTKTNVRSTEIGAVATLDIPRFLLAPHSWFRNGILPHTEVSLSYNYQKRPEYKRNIFSASYGYTWSYARKLFFKATPVQANIVRVFQLDSAFLEKNQDPFIRYLYKNHFDLGVGFNMYYTTDPSVNPTKSYFYFRLQTDVAGNLISLFNSSLKSNEQGEKMIWKSPYAQYFKIETSPVYTYKFNGGKNALAMRFLAGVGKAYGNSKVLPAEKLLWGGGAYSLRGWQARTLGPGSAPRDTTYKLPNQMGDIRLEGNIEYRFPIVWLLQGALFVDAGNIWTFNRKAENSEGEYTNVDERGVFKFNRFYKDLALDWGAGIRLDVTFVILRLDFGFKTYNPEYSKWIPAKEWLKNENFQITFGVGYPF